MSIASYLPPGWPPAVDPSGSYGFEASAPTSLSAAQTGNARIIYYVSASMSLPQQAAVIMIATAYQESWLYDLSYGTSVSRGLFQQRPSQGRGSPGIPGQP